MYEDDLVLNIPNIIKIEGGHVNSWLIWYGPMWDYGTFLDWVWNKLILSILIKSATTKIYDKIKHVSLHPNLGSRKN